MDIQSTTSLHVASWPGDKDTQNPFLTIFLGGLRQAGLRVSSLETVEAISGTEADIVLIHWPERIFAEAGSRWKLAGIIHDLLSALKARPAGTKVVWLVHNTEPHDARPLQQLIWPTYIAALIRQVDGILTLSPGTLDIVRRRYPALARVSGEGMWHPAYRDVVLAPAGRAAARAELEWDATHRVLGYCGQIRPYKGLEDLVRAFRGCAGPDLRLLIAGMTRNRAYSASLAAMAAGDPRIVLRFDTLSAEAFRAATAVCDITVAPFRRYLHSGSLVYSLSAQTPVLTPRTPFASDLRSLLGPDWVHLYDGDLTPKVLETTAAMPPPARPPDLASLSGEVVGLQAATFFARLVGRASTTPPRRVSFGGI